jgi:hypothetical protein
MELEGTLLLERSPTRRWVSIIAIVIPVASVVMVAAWFIRAYVAPPSIAIPSPMMIATAPAASPAAARVEPPIDQLPQPVPKQSAPVTVASVAAAPIAAAPEAVPSPPMVATLAVAPPNFSSLPNGQPTALADPAPMTAQAVMPEAPALDPSEPLKGPVPLPRHKPHVSVALVTGSVPLPRPRPASDDMTPADLPAYDRHGVD